MITLWNLSYSDPTAEPGSAMSKSWHFRKVLERRYELESLYTYGFKVDDVNMTYDEADFRERLESNELFPANCFILLDLEGGGWMPFDQYGVAKPEVIAARCEVYRQAKALRPDCTMGMYAYPPCSDPERVRHTKATWVHLLEAMRPLIEMQDCIVPSFYLRRSLFEHNWRDMREFTAGIAVQWVESVFHTLRAMFPATEIWPIVWPMYKDWPGWDEGASEYGYEWTPKKRVWSFVDSVLWREFLAAVRDCADALLIWGQGHCPWDAEAEWFTATLEMIHTPACERSSG